MTRLCLASWCARPYALDQIKPPHVLESYYYLRKASPTVENTIMSYVKSDQCKTFVLDSGAFTYMAQVKNGSQVVDVDFDKFVEEYAAFINKWDVQHFFELDVDVVIGLKAVERLRTKLERLTKKKCIPVFHKSRGLDYLYKMCKEYDFIALGGLAIKDFSVEEKKKLDAFINIAHEHNTKIHGLGFTNVTQLKRYNFDSVDSTSWLSGSRFGTVYIWDSIQEKFKKYSKPKNKKTVDGFYRIADERNGKEWVRFGRYLERKHRRAVLKW